LVTFGLYYPWAKVRRLRYFYGNTFVADHSLDFHGDPMRMLRGFLLVGAMLMAYYVARKISTQAALIALGSIALVWPALFRASQQFRMANTSWRGLRFGFSGTMVGAYMAIFPIFVVGLASAALFWMGSGLEGVTNLETEKIALTASGLIMALSVLLIPVPFALLKKYQHNHYVLGRVQTQLKTGVGSFYGLALKTFGIMLVFWFVLIIAMVVIAGGGAFLTWLLSTKDSSNSGAQAAGTVTIMLLGIMGLVGYFCVTLVFRPYVICHLQNLVWGNTHSREVWFESRLRFGAVLGLTLKNWFLTLLTCGFYVPFAKVNMARLRLEAITVHTRIAPDHLMNSLQQKNQDATGDAAGDFLGIDIGL
jgi:uncharacterized membrane protein YjgN (DUF898 family)